MAVPRFNELFLPVIENGAVPVQDKDDLTAGFVGMQADGNSRLQAATRNFLLYLYYTYGQRYPYGTIKSRYKPFY